MGLEAAPVVFTRPSPAGNQLSSVSIEPVTVRRRQYKTAAYQPRMPTSRKTSSMDFRLAMARSIISL